MVAYRLGTDPFPSHREYFAAEACVVRAWARWQRAVRRGKAGPRCAELRTAFEEARRAADGSRRASAEACAPVPTEAYARLAGLSREASDLLTALFVIRRPKVRRSLRAALGNRCLPRRGGVVPAHVLVELLELSEPMLREAIRELAAAGLCESVGPEGAPLSERLLCTSILALPPTSPYLLPVDSAALDGLVLADSTRTLLLEALDGHRPYLLTLDRLGVPRPPRSASRIFVLVGPAGSGKETLATAIAAYAGLQFHRLSTTSPTREPEEPVSIEYLTYLQARGPVATARDPGSLDDSPASRFGDALNEVETWLSLPETPFGPRIKILGVAHRALLTPALLNSADAVVDLEHGSPAEHRKMWRTLVPAGALAAGVDAGDLAELAPLAPGAIVTTLRRALRAAQAADSEMGLGLEDLRRALPVPESVERRGCTEPVAPEVTLERLVLLPETREKVDEMVAFAGLDLAAVAELGVPGLADGSLGLVSLFEGPPGTGKTACAVAVAHRLGRELVSADLGSLLGRYVGDSESNVKQLFVRARERPSVLFIDEADALLSARQVRIGSEHDNRLVNLLLVELERHPGPVILATNLRDALDPALARRIQFRVPFGPPDVASRRALWRLHLSGNLPGVEALDLDAVASEFPLTGAQIRNVARRVALRTLTLGRPVEMPELRALASEQQSGATAGTARRTVGFRA